MPIDKDGIIYVEKKAEKQIENVKKTKKKNINIKDICLIISTCISILGVGFMINQNKLQKLEYENHIKELELEKSKYENMLKENNIEMNTSYIVCEAGDVGSLFSSFKDYNINMYTNDITDLFYNSRTRSYYDNEDIMRLDAELRNTYTHVRAEIIFLRIDIIGNRVARNIALNFLEIKEENNINRQLLDFTSFVDLYGENGQNVIVNIGDAFPNDMILIPLAVRYSENISYFSLEEYEMINFMETTYRTIYIPQSISYYDMFYEKTFNLEIRDMLNGAFVTDYKYMGLG